MNDVITKGMSTISVKGKGHIDARLDEATLSVEVEKVSLSQEDASEEATRFMNSVISILLDIGIAEENISTQQISISPYKTQGVCVLPETIESRLSSFLACQRCRITAEGHGTI